MPMKTAFFRPLEGKDDTVAHRSHRQQQVSNQVSHAGAQSLHAGDTTHLHSERSGTFAGSGSLA